MIKAYYYKHNSELHKCNPQPHPILFKKPIYYIVSKVTKIIITKKKKKETMPSFLQLHTSLFVRVAKKNSFVHGKM